MSGYMSVWNLPEGIGTFGRTEPPDLAAKKLPQWYFRFSDDCRTFLTSLISGKGKDLKTPERASFVDM